MTIEANDVDVDVDVEVPVGAVLPYAGPINTCTQTKLRKRGWLLCDGSPVSRASYPELWAVLRRLYGYPPDSTGAAVFCLPDYRGVFLRGLDRGAAVDPEASTRTYADPSDGNGNQGDQVGSRQGEAVEDHEHQYAIAYLQTSPPVPPPTPGGLLGVIGEGAAPLMTGTTATSAVTISGGQPDISETRPINAAVNFIIKCQSRVPDPGPVGDWCGNDTQDTWPPPAVRADGR